MIGTVVGNFCIVAPLGKGGMGEVWLAEQQSIKTKVAIKLLHADISADVQHVQRFFNEAVAVSKIRHAGIAKIFDVGFLDTQAYLVMEYLEGESLARRIARRGRLSLAEVCDLGRQVAGVLDATHAAGITHRDLKPDNIFLVPDAELPSGERAKVLDFGIAKLGSVGMTSTSVSSMGTPLYMSPEQWKSVAKVDGRADAYSLGCVVFEMACGRPPFLADSMGEACAKHLTEEPPRPGSLVPGVPPAFDQLVARLLEKDPALRPTLKDVMAALGAIAQTVPAAPPPGADAPSAPLPTAPVSPVAATVGTASRLPAAVVPASMGFAPHAGTGQPMAMAPHVATGQPPAPVVTTLGGATGASGVAPPVSARRGKRAGWLIAGGAVVVAGGAAAIVLASRGPDPAASPAAGSQTVVVQQPPPSPPPAPPPPPPSPASADAPLVSPTAVRRVSGEPPKNLRSAVAPQLCIDPTGAVTSVEVGLDVDRQLADEVKAKLATWRYAPYQRDGAAIAVCFQAMLQPAPPVVAGGGSGKPPEPPKPPKPPKPPTPSLPEELDNTAISNAMAQIRSRVDACAGRLAGRATVRVKVTVSPDGRVLAARSQRAPRPVIGSCVARAVEGAVFPKTLRGGSFTHAFDL